MGSIIHERAGVLKERFWQRLARGGLAGGNNGLLRAGFFLGMG